MTTHPTGLRPPAPAGSAARAEMVDSMAKMALMLGLPKSTGQIYGLLYLSPEALALEVIADRLSISKASVCTGVRELVAWHVVRQVFVAGDRRDYYEAESDLREVLQTLYQEAFKPKLGKVQRRLDSLLSALESDRKAGLLSRDDYSFCKVRLENVGRMQDRLLKWLPLVEKLL